MTLEYTIFQRFLYFFSIIYTIFQNETHVYGCVKNQEWTSQLLESNNELSDGARKVLSIFLKADIYKVIFAEHA